MSDGILLSYVCIFGITISQLSCGADSRDISNLPISKSAPSESPYFSSWSLLWDAAGKHHLATCRELESSEVYGRRKEESPVKKMPRVVQEILDNLRKEGNLVKTEKLVVWIQSPEVKALTWTPLDAEIGAFFFEGNMKGLNEALSAHIQSQNYGGGAGYIHHRPGTHAIKAHSGETYREFFRRIAREEGICSRAVVRGRFGDGPDSHMPANASEIRPSLFVLLQ